MIRYLVNSAHLPFETYHRNDRYWPVPKQKPYLLGATS